MQTHRSNDTTTDTGASGNTARSAATHTGVFALGLAAAFLFGRQDESSGEPLERTPAVAEVRAEPPCPCLDQLVDRTPATDRFPVAERELVATAPISPPTVELKDLACGDLRTELMRRIAELQPAIERAFNECGFRSAELVPFGLGDALMHSVADDVRKALESGDMEQVAGKVSELLLEMRGQLTLDLRTKLQNTGVAPVSEVNDLILPDAASRTSRISVGSVTSKDNKVAMYLIESGNGIHFILPVPEPLQDQARAIVALQVAGVAADKLDR